jgi:cysteine desulfuration protein SufE
VSLADRQREMVARLAIIEDPQERLAALISRGKKWPAPEPAQMTEPYRIRGCQSRVWLVPTVEEGQCHFRMECDSPMVKGLVALLCELYEGGTACEVRELEPTLIEELGLSRMISPTRLNGLAAVRTRIREFVTGRD